jgi:hypothetical protein
VMRSYPGDFLDLDCYFLNFSFFDAFDLWFELVSRSWIRSSSLEVFSKGWG